MSSSSSNVSLTDYQGYSSGSYMAYVAPWNKGSYVQGTNYNESIELTPAFFPNSVVITSNWGNNTSNSVFGFNAIDYGDYDNTNVPTPIASAQIKNIAALTETHSLTLSGATNGFDVIDDMFLTSGAGSTTTHEEEIEIFLHTPAYSAAYVQSAKQIGTFVGSGITWTVAETSGTTPDILIMPTNKAEVTSATIDIKGMFDYLIAQNVLTGNEYFNGMALGSETQTGNGTTTVNGFSVNYLPASGLTASAVSTSSAKQRAAAVTEALLHDTGASTTNLVTSVATLTGTAAANAVVTFTEGTSTLGTTTADANGLWTYQPTGLADGSHTISASASGSVASLSFTLETKAPILTGGLKNDTGISATDHVTSDPTLTGYADANAVVTFMEGTRTLGAVTADATGAWTFKPTGLADGYNPVVASETNAAGLTTNTDLGFVLDTSPKPLSMMLTNDTGSSSTDKITSDPTLNGWTESNAAVTLTEGNTTLGTVMSNASGAWSFKPTGLTDGTQTIVATEADQAGNIATASLTFTLETKAPLLIGGLKNDTGISATDNITSDPTLTGHADANAVVTFTEGTRTLGAVTADATGAWTFKPTGLADGYNPVVASETDAAGLTTKTSFGFVLDTTPPSITEALKSTGVVNQATGMTQKAIIGGFAMDNAKVTIAEDGRILGSTIAGANGAWSYAPGNVTAGTHTFAASTVDVAGNTASTSSSFTFAPTRFAMH